jgi:hypothetical protein
VSDWDILNERELAHLESSSGDDCDMAAVQCVVRELRDARCRLSALEAENERLRAERDEWKRNHDGAIGAGRRIETRLTRERDTALSDLARVRAENEQAALHRARSREILADLKEENERMRPVYEAAVQWRRLAKDPSSIWRVTDAAHAHIVDAIDTALKEGT